MINMTILYFNIIRADETFGGKDNWFGRPSEYIRYEGDKLYHIVEYTIRKSKLFYSKILFSEEI